MYFRFAWRYFKAKKSANAINIIAWVTTGVIAFATCCQILVLSVFNGFEDLVKSLYSSFYADIKISPAKGKTFFLDPAAIKKIKALKNIQHLSLNAEEKALLKFNESQTIVQLKGVDTSYSSVCNLSSNILSGSYNLGNTDYPKIIMGVGIQNALGLSMNEAFGPEDLTIILPKQHSKNTDPIETLSEGNARASAVFSIQQEFDNSYAFTNIDFVKQQMGFQQNEYSSVAIKLKQEKENEITCNEIRKIVGNEFLIKNRYQQNTNLYSTMKTEKWAIYALLCLILMIAAFNMISALTMLVLEKKQDIAILQSMGATKRLIRNIFITEGFLLGIIGTSIGTITAAVICWVQLKFKLIKLQGGSFLIDYFPVKCIASDFILVVTTALIITTLASWLPAKKASEQTITLK
jgi:lipoprotein-releasing system permease protein